MANEIHNVHAEEYKNATELAKLLGVKPSTVRKYSILIQNATGNQDYFEKDISNARLYNSKQVEKFQQLLKLKNQPNMTLQKAIEQVFTPSSVEPSDAQNKPIKAVPKGTQQLVQLVQENAKREQQRDKAIEQLQRDNADLKQANKELNDKLDRITKLLETKPVKKHWWQRF